MGRGVISRVKHGTGSEILNQESRGGVMITSFQKYQRINFNFIIFK
jgi:hypothetical protein